MALSPGSRLGPYEILSPLGEGGMGEVYRAEDKRLDRHVAVKILRAAFSKDHWVLTRFEQEARSASALNHPNIVTIYDIGQTESLFYFAMEFIDGKNLREILQEGPPPVRRLVHIAAQMADGLARAHAAGIVHRDLKPENIMVTNNDIVKILDFGVAKLGAEHTDVPSSPTVRLIYPTEPGVILGTVGYMSPEQAKMEPVDYRSDQFSFGTILYELSTGKRAFEHENAVDTMSSIIHDEPAPIVRVNPRIPAALRWIIERCLAKDPRNRYASTDDLARDLAVLRERLSEVLSVRESPALTGRSLSGRFGPAVSRIRVASLVAAALLFLGAGLAWIAGYRLHLNRPGSAERIAARSTFFQLTFGSDIKAYPSLSPDETTFVFVSAPAGHRNIFLQRIDGRNAIDLTADAAADDDEPAFSPDGGQIVFRSERDGGGLFLMGATGESVRRVTNFGHNPSWSPDGKEVVCATEGIFDPFVRETTSELWIVSVATGDRRRLKTGDAVQPSWSPHGVRIAYWGLPAGGGERDIWTLPARATGIAAVPVKVVADGSVNWNPIWSPDGRFLYYASDRGGTMSLWRVPISEESGKVRGEPEALTLPARWSGHFTLSRDGGRLLFMALDRRSSLERVGFDPVTERLAGLPAPVFHGTLTIEGFDLSPDSASIAFASQSPEENVFVMNADGKNLRQLTTGKFRNRGIRWSPDGRWISFHTNSSGSYEIWRIHPDGSGLSQMTKTGDAIGGRWSPDGTRLLYLNDKGTCLVDLAAAAGGAKPEKLPPVNARGDSFFVYAWSPDGKILAGQVLQPNGDEVPGVFLYSLESRKYTRIADDGTSPNWMADSRRLLYLSDGNIFLVDVRTGARHRVAFPAPRGPSDLHAVWQPLIENNDAIVLSTDNRQIYFVRAASQSDIWEMTLPR